MKTKWIRKAHRWLGLVFSLTLLMASGSGVIHVIMTRTQDPPPPARPAGGALDAAVIRVPVAEAVSSATGSADGARSVNLRSIGGRPYYQIFGCASAKPLYVSGIDGRPGDSLDEMYAAEIAASFLGSAAVRKTGYLESFDREYLPIFRILPVHRLDLDDGKGTRVYVSTLTGSVTRHTNHRAQFEAGLFSLFHKLAFIPNKNLRDWVLIVSTGGVFLLTALGVLLFFLTGPKPKRH